MLRVCILMSCAAVSGMLHSGAVLSQGTAGVYPSKPVTFIVPSAPGGPTDAEARLYAAKLGELMGQPFLLEHKPGAGTTIGTGYVAKAVPDGYTLLIVTSGFAVTPSLYKDLPFDIIKDFAPVALMSQKSLVLVVRSTFPANNLVEYLAYAKANPGKINYGTTGDGGTAHLVGAWIHGATNTKVTYIAYKGTAPMVIDMLAGRVDVTGATLQIALPQLKSEKLRALAITGDKSSELMPGVRTVAEQGIPGYKYTTWLGIVAPGATPAAIVNRLSDGLIKTVKMADVVATIEAAGSEAIGGTPAQFRQLLVSETANWRKIVQGAGIKINE